MIPAQAEATKILFDLVSGLDNRFRPLASWFQTITTTLDKWATSEGNQGVKRMKSILETGWQLILGETPDSIAFCKQSNGIPKLVQPLLTWSKGYTKDDRLMSGVLSLVRVTDIFQGVELDSTVNSNLLTIRESRVPPSAKPVIEEYRNFLSLFMAQYPNAPVTKAIGTGFKLMDHHTTYYRESRGPNGPLTANAHRDILSLRESVCQNGTSLLEAVTHLENEIIRTTRRGWKSSTDLQLALEGWDGSENLQHSECPGKISLVPEKSAKVRLVAQPDYWSQLALRPVHDWLCGVLRALPSDCTYDQGSAIPKIGKWQDEGRQISSFDQSSCTDLFPFDLQLVLLQTRFGTSLSEAVKTVMVDRDWEVTFPQSGRTQKVRWKAGQPMGLLASWPLMAASHHLLVQYSYWVSNGRTFGKSKSPYSRYVICGDDIVIADKSVADAYRSIVKRLGMKINLSKSHVSGGHTGVEPVSEFAKIIVWKGHPLFPIRPNMVLSAVKDWHQAVPLLLDLARYNGWRAKRKLLDRVIRSHFPQGKRYLAQFLTLPSEFGGCGYRDSEPMRKKFQLVHANQIHPWLYYLGTVIRSGIQLEQATLNLAPLEGADELPPSVLRKHPLYEHAVRLASERSGTAHLYNDRVPSVPEICYDLVLHGFESYERFMGADCLEPVPDFQKQSDLSRNARKVVTRWEKSLFADNKLGYHAFPKQPFPPCLKAIRALGYHGIESPEFREVMSDAQLAVVERAMLAMRVKSGSPS